MKRAGLALLGAIGVFAVAAWQLGGDTCASTVVSESWSPSGRLVVVVFERDCGATTSYSTQVSVLSKGEQLASGAGNVFICDSDHGKAPVGATRRGPSVNARWISDEELEIQHHARVRVFKAVSEFANVRVRYVAGK